MLWCGLLWVQSEVANLKLYSKINNLEGLVEDVPPHEEGWSSEHLKGPF